MELESNTIEELKKEIALLKRKLEPDELAKQIDKSYLSVNNLRCFLQILSIFITIFIAGAVGFGIFGVQNIYSINKIASDMNGRYDNFKTKEGELNKKVADIYEIESAMKDRYRDFQEKEKSLTAKVDTRPLA